MQTQVSTDANGYAETAVTANGLMGDYAVTATAAGGSASFTLRNTVAPVGTGGLAGGGGLLSVSGPSPSGAGTVTVTVQSAAQALPAHAYFSQAGFNTTIDAGVPPLAGRSFPFGLVSFVLENVGAGNSVRMRLDYPSAVPAGATYWKYGRSTLRGCCTGTKSRLLPPVHPGWKSISLTVVRAIATA